jgi:hypothetical protein
MFYFQCQRIILKTTPHFKQKEYLTSFCIKRQLAVLAQKTCANVGLPGML